MLWRLTAVGWTSAGPENGVPEAFTAVDDETYLAWFDTVVHRSDDAGASWQALPVAAG
ncbi:hypothetical protein [Georgenia yuyongxinii]|uniref:hypothetical protein n=1 Tax=Georgenia yuyongxinii TaxID=2589797 RepID=UPI00163D5EA8|nr:hypothetical protein [Georgenia yuyongxinii]